MDEDEHKPAKKYPISISKLSKTPSWVMLGFVLGALFVIALPPIGDEKSAAAPPPPVDAPKPAPTPPLVTTIQAVFEDPRWEGFANWSNDTTEVALWNHDTRAFDDYYEVRRIGGTYYYRSITSLTRPVMKNVRGLAEDCPLRFTYANAQEFFTEARPPRRIERSEHRPTAVPKPKVDLPEMKFPDRQPPAAPKYEFQVKPVQPAEK